MKRRLLTILVVLAVFFPFAGYCFMTFTREPGTVPKVVGMSEELRQLIDTDRLVMGADGPVADSRVYCAGNTAELNAFLDDFASVPDATKTIVLHPGRETCKYPRLVFGPDGISSGEVEEVLDVDWALHVSEYAPFRKNKADFKGKKFLTTVDIWLGGQVEFDELVVPPSIPLKSSDEFEEFINKHETRRQRQDSKA